MKVGLRSILSLLDPRQRHGETDESLSRFGAEFAVKSTDHLAPDLLRQQKSLAGNHVVFVVAPGFDLELDARFQLVKSVAQTNLDHGRAACFASRAAASWSGAASFASFFFA